MIEPNNGNQAYQLVLLNPPLTFSHMPELAVGSLRAYAKSIGIRCTSFDLGVRFISWLMRPGGELETAAKEKIRFFHEIQRSLSPNDDDDAGVDLRHLAEQLAEIPRHIWTQYIEEQETPTKIRWAGPEVERRNEFHRPYGDTTPRVFAILSKHGANAVDRKAAVDHLQVVLMRSFMAFLDSPEAVSILETAAKAAVVGLSVSYEEQQKLISVAIAARLKQINPEVRVVFGGASLAYMSDQARQEILAGSNCVDALALYAGESILLDLVKAAEDRRSFEEVTNLVLFDQKNEKLLRTPEAAPVHPRNLPAPEYEREVLPMYRKLSNGVLSLPVLAAYGCYWDRCAFCNDRYCRQPGVRFLENPAIMTAEHVELLSQQYGADMYHLISSAVSQKWGKTFCREIVKRGLRAKFWAYFRCIDPAKSDPEFFHLLRAAGFSFLTLGVESTIDRVLEAVEKGNDREAITHTITSMTAVDVGAKFNLIWDLPPITKEEVRANLDYLKEYAAFINYLRVFDFTLDKDSDMGMNPGEYGLDVAETEVRTGFGSSGEMPFKSPLHQEPGAAVTREPFERIGGKISILQKTQGLRDRISSSRFTWENACFLFEPLVFLSSSASILDRSCEQEVHWVLQPTLGLAFELPTTYKRFVDALVDATTKPVWFSEFLGALVADREESGRQTEDIEIETFLKAFLTKAVHKGQVSNVLCRNVLDFDPNGQSDVEVKIDDQAVARFA